MGGAVARTLPARIQARLHRAYAIEEAPSVDAFIGEAGGHVEEVVVVGLLELQGGTPIGGDEVGGVVEDLHRFEVDVLAHLARLIGALRCAEQERPSTQLTRRTASHYRHSTCAQR